MARPEQSRTAASVVVSGAGASEETHRSPEPAAKSSTGVAHPAITDAQVRTLAAIDAHVREESWPPTLRELGARLGVTSTNGTSEMLDRLERDGLVEREPLRARALRVTPAGHALLALLAERRREDEPGRVVRHG